MTLSPPLIRPLRHAAFTGILLAAIAASAASAHEFKLGPITIDHPWARASAVKTSAAYMTLSIAGGSADRLLKAESPAAGSVELHTTIVEQGIAKMRPVLHVEVKPGAATELKPGGIHIMLIDLKLPLKEGESVKLRLTFEKAGTIEVNATVEKAGAPPPKH